MLILPDQLAELVQLFKVLGFPDLTVGEGPGILELRDNFDQWLVVFQLRVHQLDVSLVLPDQLPVGHERRTDTFSQSCHGARVLLDRLAAL